MSLLSTLRQNRGNRTVPPATHATFATHHAKTARTVATVATVARAIPIKVKTDTPAKISYRATAHDADPAIAYRAWLIHYIDHDPVQVFCTPPKTHDEILASHPDAIAAEPLEDCTTGGALHDMSTDEDETLRAWLEHIGETECAAVGLLMSQWRHDIDARKTLLKEAKAVLPRFHYGSDDRHLCSQCKNLRGNVCAVASPGGLVSASRNYMPTQNRPVRCAGYESKGL
jgi:hypothetical protein